MDREQVIEKLRLLFQLANELREADLPIVRQRADAIVGLTSELMVTVAGDADWRVVSESAGVAGHTGRG